MAQKKLKMAQKKLKMARKLKNGVAINVKF